ncbi:MAG: Uma2 family endonuclease [Myxococcales bacterium]|nr:Uma2 family endonuclease [Myxococcales bacterium]
MDAQRRTLPEWAYPASEKRPVTTLHHRLRTTLFTQTERHLRDQGVRAFTGSNQFVYFEEGNPRKAMEPDLYVFLDEDPAMRPDKVKTWEWRAPDMVLEIRSRRGIAWHHDLAPRFYAEMGVKELILLDPTLQPPRDVGGILPEWKRLHVFRQTSPSTSLRYVADEGGDRAWSDVIGAEFRWDGEAEPHPTMHVSGTTEAIRARTQELGLPEEPP